MFGNLAVGSVPVRVWVDKSIELEDVKKLVKSGGVYVIVLVEES